MIDTLVSILIRTSRVANTTELKHFPFQRCVSGWLGVVHWITVRILHNKILHDLQREREREVQRLRAVTVSVQPDLARVRGIPSVLAYHRAHCA
jgi:hypothetical protein